MSEDLEVNGGMGEGGRRKRRRRRRRKGGGEGGGDLQAAGPREGREGREPREPREPREGRGRGASSSDPEAGAVALPSSGLNPHRKRASRARRGPPGVPGARKRRLSRVDADAAAGWLARMPEGLLSQLHRGLGGQPGRAGGGDRVVQLVIKALTQGNRLGGLVKGLQERDRKALAGLLQAGGLAHADELHRELSLSYGGHEREWARSLSLLADKGLVMASADHDGVFFYIVPDPLVDPLLAEIDGDLALPTFDSPDVRIIEERPFCPPLDFSITSLATYIDQRSPRLSQRQEIYRHDQEDMDRFFSQLWEPQSELFNFHLDFLMMHGMVELRGEYLALNREVMEEWLQLDPEDQRDLVFRALERRFHLAEWVLWALDAAGEGWIAERPLMGLYRRWKRGLDWRERYQRKTWGASKAFERESFSFAPLVRCGVLEMGQWGQEKFYRLSVRGKHLLHPPEDDGFRQFYLTPSFEIMAPAGLAPVLLFRIGELAQLIGCDRANTYRITEPVIERAMERGWRRDDVLQFLRDNSQIGVPENVEMTLKGWIGHRGDVEFHDLCLMTVHRSQIRRLESSKRAKPYILHRFAPGMYAVDRSRREEISALLQEMGFSPSRDVRGYPGDPTQVEARASLHRLVAEARESGIDPSSTVGEVAPPESLHAVPGTRVAGKVNKERDQLPLVTPEEARALIDQAVIKQTDLEMVYLSKDGARITTKVEPHRIAFKGDDPVMVGLDHGDNERKTYPLSRIERMRMVEAR